MAAKPTMILPVVLLVAILSFTNALPSETISNAAETLSDSGYIAMSLTLNLVSSSLLSQTSSATIFTPPDSIFTELGQPPQSLLELHISPLGFSFPGLRSLDPGTKIPTMSSDNYLTITSPSSSDQVSINNVKILGSPIFDDGSLIIFGIEKFFDSNFTVSDSPAQIPSINDCETPYSGGNSFSFHEASNVLISRGYSVMASFLNLQLLGFLSQPSLTLFAPADEVMVDYSGRFPDYPSLFLRHVLPCKISLKDLVNIENGTNMNTYLNGFRINVTRSGATLKVNELPIAFPDMYYSDWLVIHGVPAVLSLSEPADDEDNDDSDGDTFDTIPFRDSGDEVTVPDASTRSTEF
ncbi:putative fasciclin-like arabinogalactan protein 20 [Lactuca sativa]|uniref:putative fasciclin-like arabinogalactan protein 20 n=1 Tax=Lactuca sativa TaxID=4236 RepID=UPI000CB5AA1E|nr:putative fasciclin-like arabinogalactan protein 20 [Lactuca sativa]